MAINKNKNVNLQLTISKQDNEYLVNIQEQLRKSLNIELTKSQTISYLLKQYRFNGMNQNQEHQQADIKQKKQKDIKEYQAKTNALKDKLNVSYTKLSALLGIHQSTIKKYCSGKQSPTGDNKKILDQAFNKYGIK